MPILGSEMIQAVNPDPLAVRVFLKALDLMGGPRQVIAYRNLTWLPSLLEAAYIIVLAREYERTSSEIAAMLGITEQTVRNVLRSDPAQVKARLEEEVRGQEPRVHVAGALAKWAYEEIKAGRDKVSFLD